MKRGDLIRLLRASGCRLKRHGGGHDIYENQKTGRIAPVPRHSEIKDTLCILICSQLEVPYRPGRR